MPDPVFETRCPAEADLSDLPTANGAMTNEELRTAVLTAAARILALPGKERPDTGFPTVFWAWARISAAFDSPLPRYMTPNHGCLAIGPLRFPRNMGDYGDTGTRTVCRKSGAETMCRAYEKLLPGDALVSTVQGQVFLVSEAPKTAFLEDGSPDPAESRVFFLKRPSLPTAEKESDGGRGSRTFRELERQGFVPLRPAELAGVSSPEKAVVTTSITTVKSLPEKIHMEDVRAGTLFANYAFAEVEARAAAGEREVFRITAPGRISPDPHRFRLAELELPQDLSVPEAELVLTARLSNGERVTAYRGTLVQAPPVPKLKKTVTARDFDALPVADPSMTEEELRDLAVRYAMMQTTLPWTPSDTFYYHCPSVLVDDANGNLSFHRGVIYGGVPYSTHCADAYAFLETLDENGVLDVEKIGMGLMELVGNHCSGSLFWAWGRISSRVTYHNTDTMLPANGCLPLGGIRYDDTFRAHSLYGTRRIVADNGEQKMFEAYALLKPADGMVFSLHGYGHSCMIASPVHVARREDGTIDGEESYMEVVEQHTPFTPHETENGTVQNIGGSPTRQTFAKSFSLGHIPFRIPEFCGQPLEKARFALGFEKDLKLIFTPEELRETVLTCNYPISRVWVTVTAPGGREVTVGAHGVITSARRIEFASFIPEDLPAGKLVIRARAGNGEVQTLFEGRLDRF